METLYPLLCFFLDMKVGFSTCPICSHPQYSSAAAAAARHIPLRYSTSGEEPWHAAAFTRHRVISPIYLVKVLALWEGTRWNTSQGNTKFLIFRYWNLTWKFKPCKYLGDAWTSVCIRVTPPPSYLPFQHQQDDLQKYGIKEKWLQKIPEIP